jgi:thioredoxin reductase (NADPH)
MEHTRVAVIGSGPTGYTAAIYTARASLAPTVFTGEKSGGQLMFTTDVENFPGFPDGKDGPELMMNMRAQAEKFGAVMKDQYVYAVDLTALPFKLWTHLPAGFLSEIMDKGTPEEFQEMRKNIMAEPHDYEADAVVLAVGARAKMLDVPGETQFLGRGVSTCAVCDAAFYRNRNTIVVGGGDTAMEDTLALTKFADHVTVLVRGEKMRASKVMQDRVLAHPKVTVRFNTTISEVRGEGLVKEVQLKNTSTGEEEAMAVDGVFIAIGHSPMTQILQGQLELDSHGFIITRQSPSAAGVAKAQAALDADGKVSFPTMTSVEGVFAGGDAVDTRYWQAVTAAAQGCSAAIDAERWIEGR